MLTLSLLSDSAYAVISIKYNLTNETLAYVSQHHLTLPFIFFSLIRRFCCFLQHLKVISHIAGEEVANGSVSHSLI